MAFPSDPVDIANKKPEYTRHTKAWPQLEIHRHAAIEEILVDPAEGSGFRITWYNFRRVMGRDSIHIEIGVFQDALEFFTTARVLNVITRIKKMSTTPTPEQVIKILESQGFVPSKYHTQHDLETSNA